MRKKIFRIISIAITVLVVLSVYLALRSPAGPPPSFSAAAARSFDSKVTSLLEAHQRGEPIEIRLNETEINSKLHEMLAGASAAGPENLRGATMHLTGNLLVCTLAVRVHGVPVYVTLSGTLGLRNHRLDFHLTAAQVGSLPIPAALLAGTLSQKLESPGAQETLRMPGFVSDLRVEQGELVLRTE